ncbi:unnamed protein product [Albugo candida]|uniref:Uncharacterized protein n=1 Tax=Albugo candida TaxID=65357 RepID=A0A024G4K3_9STRA|nr:unnamed protein product [Albugo candida]|eukprot:CCI41239.1 unnamed protein product [Albugo candida]
MRPRPIFSFAGIILDGDFDVACNHTRTPIGTLVFVLKLYRPGESKTLLKRFRKHKLAARNVPLFLFIKSDLLHLIRLNTSDAHTAKFGMHYQGYYTLPDLSSSINKRPSNFHRSQPEIFSQESHLAPNQYLEKSCQGSPHNQNRNHFLH